MNRDQQRRLDAVSAAVMVPCIGCLAEDASAAEELVLSEARHEVIWQIEAGYSRERKEPAFVLDWSDQDREARTAAYQAEMRRLDEQFTVIAALPQSARRNSCPNCSARKRFRQAFKLPCRLRLDWDHVDLEEEPWGEPDEPDSSGGPETGPDTPG